MLPFFFRHYDPFVDTYFVADHGSTDQSPSILRAHPKVVLTEFQCSEESFVESARTHYNACWKTSRGNADWVIICNIDEHFYHPRLLRYLIRSKSEGITLIRPQGYHMIARTFPCSHRSLKSQVRIGQRDSKWDKPQLFDPDSIEHIHFSVGRHSATPSGFVKEDRSGRVKLLHYKYMGEAYLSTRSADLRARMKPVDVINNWGCYGTVDEIEKARRRIQNATSQAVPIYSSIAPLFFLGRLVRFLRTVFLRRFYPDYFP
jgi:hypothetical protein